MVRAQGGKGPGRMSTEEASRRWNAVTGPLFLAAGAVFAVLGNPVWPVFLVLGITFLGLTAGPGKPARRSDPQGPDRDR
ncbi:hypothetical protein [Rathayibacter sp. VKM Ac-2801]|uniref:hypothetical protein n=1 Tax=Rathayibacter sp. VKM Ac-2801 TaxID=2609255 RepID=UPI0013201011|nr:hypothetical protein [Rathayibacter sp. VKM Ac-2801]QHC69161.1 hypothetical protein GSU45_01355 [Rathayibacter sp. VKM Ac-2801]